MSFLPCGSCWASVRRDPTSLCSPGFQDLAHCPVLLPFISLLSSPRAELGVVCLHKPGLEQGKPRGSDPHLCLSMPACSKLQRGERVSLFDGINSVSFLTCLPGVQDSGLTSLGPRAGPSCFQNAALFWWNLHRSGEGDGDTLHAGCPVLVGDKWGKACLCG